MKYKPLGIKCYGSIGHLPGSRMGTGDHHCPEGQGNICTVKKRDRHDSIIVQEKLDGSCVGVAKIDGELVPLGRSGYTALSSPFEQHHLFHHWVMSEDLKPIFDMILHDGERIVGEWLAQAHGTRYHLEMRIPFVAFDIFREGKRLDYDNFIAALTDGHKTDNPYLSIPKLLSREDSLPIEEAMKLLGPNGYYGAMDQVEGVVYRVERFDKKKMRSEVDFLAKYVRPDKSDGSYLPEVSGKEAVWNWRPQ